MNIPIYLVSKILLYRPYKEEFKIISTLISDYEYWLNIIKRNDISFKKYYFTQVKHLSQNENTRKEMDINYVYDWLLKTYSSDNYYTKEEAYEDLRNDDLISEFQEDHYNYQTCKVDIKIGIKKLRKYLIHSKIKLIKNHFKEFLML